MSGEALGEHPEEVVNVWRSYGDGDTHYGQGQGGESELGKFSYADFALLRSQVIPLSSVAIHGALEMGLARPGEPTLVQVGRASASLFDVLELRPVIGRRFLPRDDGPAGDSVALLSFEIWQDRFRGANDVIGRTLSLDDRNFTVIGVLPPDFRLSTWASAGGTRRRDTRRRDIWVPAGQAQIHGLNPQNRVFEMSGRLPPETTSESAAADIRKALLLGSLATSEEILIEQRAQADRRNVQPFRVLLLVSTAMLFLVMCANAVTVAVSDARRRRSETALRLALGACRARVVRQTLADNLTKAILGCALSLLLTAIALTLLAAHSSVIPGMETVRVEPWLALIAFALTLVTGLCVSVAPSILSARTPQARFLANSAMGCVSRDVHSQRTVISMGIALTVMLLVAAGLLTRSFANLLAVDLGFDDQDLATIQVRLLPENASDPREAVRVFSGIQRAVEAIPGVMSASGTRMSPYQGEGGATSVMIDGSDETFIYARSHVLPRFHETLRIPVVAGRVVKAEDGPDATRIAVVSESMANELWPGDSAIGQAITCVGLKWTVVGVVGDVRSSNFYQQKQARFYLPYAQLPTRTLNLVARTSDDPRTVLPLLREAVWSVDADIPVANGRTVSSYVVQSLKEEQFLAALFTILALLGTLLAAVGVVGVSTEVIRQRTRELRIRTALGASSRDTMRIALRSGMSMGLIGTLVGAAGALLANRALTEFLFGVDAWDVPTYVAVASLVLAVSGGASYLPVRRASVINPSEVLRAE